MMMRSAKRSAKLEWKVPSRIHEMEPLLPERTGELQDLALEVIQKSAVLGGRQHPVTLRSLRDFLRIINSYYSNLIEGHNTHPHDIVRAMRNNYDSEPAKRNLQLESTAHIAVQQDMEKRLEKEPELQITSSEFICYLHREFYLRVPDEFKVVEDIAMKRQSRVMPGELRKEGVKVGNHVPPDYQTLPAFLKRFTEFYDPRKHHGAIRLVAAASAHQRLMWIHPFLDGNGRVARFFTEAYLLRIPVHGFGLWSVSRGLARKNVEYKAALAEADNPRRNDIDGRGNLSSEALVRFCRFFLNICLDQVEYMGGLLRLEELLKRIRQYIDMRNSGMIAEPEMGKKLRSEAAGMLKEVVIRGETSRGEVIAASGLKERTGRDLLGQLLQEELLVSDTPKGNVRLGFPVHAAGWYFPDLYGAR
ncbi:Filamentation induced by cAMP protein Fic [Syntrophobacter sp. SbD1]|nr:Filamentation induced by cAMP protein Fic [Syntrophobacter sp. SbD1]